MFMWKKTHEEIVRKLQGEILDLKMELGLAESHAAGIRARCLNAEKLVEEYQMRRLKNFQAAVYYAKKAGLKNPEAAVDRFVNKEK